MKYSANSYEEAFTSTGSVRSSFKKFYSWYKQQNLNSLNKKKLDSISFIKNTGVTFNVYGQNENKETFIPFDFIPRIITELEWNKIVDGIKQRVKAINFFLNDIYSYQEILKSNVIPINLIKSNSAFMTEMLNIKPPGGIYNHISGIDLVKTNKNEFYVLEDNVRVPSGVSYMIENRDIMLNLFPDLVSKYKIKEVRNYPKELSRILKKSSPRKYRTPKIVVLTPGIYNSAYFEHAFLADQLGVELVEGKDLCVRDNNLNMKTINGWEKIDIIYRRIDDQFLDPLTLNRDSLLGIPGLMEVYRNNNVTISNAPGSGIADDKAIYSYMPEIIKFYLNEKPILKNVKTYKCGNVNELRFVLKNINNLVIKEVHGSGGYGMLIGPLANKKQLEVFKKKLTLNPSNYIAQPTLSLSTCPIFSKYGLEPRHVDLRPFALLSNTDICWSKVQVTLVDDRLVDARSDESNQKLINEKFLINNAKKAKFFPLNQELIIKKVFMIPFNIVLLGMGEDGHFASLFPEMINNHDAFDINADSKILNIHSIGNPFVPRITMNLSLILKSEIIFLIVKGNFKQNILSKALEDDSYPIHYLIKNRIKNIYIEKIN